MMCIVQRSLGRSELCLTAVLSSQELQGPDLTNLLVSVLTRFRQEPVAFMNNIKAMFYQALVPAEQRDFLRFLWRPNGDINDTLGE